MRANKKVGKQLNKYNIFQINVCYGLILVSEKKRDNLGQVLAKIVVVVKFKEFVSSHIWINSIQLNKLNVFKYVFFTDILLKMSS